MVLLVLLAAAFAQDEAIDRILERTQAATACVITWDAQEVLLRLDGDVVRFEVDEQTAWKVLGGRFGRIREAAAQRCLDDVFEGLALGDDHWVEVGLQRAGGGWNLDVAACGQGASDLTEVRGYGPHVRGCAAVFGEDRDWGVLTVDLSGEAPAVVEDDKAMGACVTHALGDGAVTGVHQAKFAQRLDGPSTASLDLVSGWTGLSWGSQPTREMHPTGEYLRIATFERPSDRAQNEGGAARSRVAFAGYPVSSLEYAFFDNQLFRVSFTVFEADAIAGIQAALEERFGRARPQGHQRSGWTQGEVSLVYDPKATFPTYSFLHVGLAESARREGAELGPN